MGSGAGKRKTYEVVIGEKDASCPQTSTSPKCAQNTQTHDVTTVANARGTLLAPVAASTLPLPINTANRQASMITCMKKRGSKRKKGVHYDLIVLGAGPAGMKAAVEASSRGQYVALIEPKFVVTGVPTGAHSKCLREAALHGARTWPEIQDVLTRAVGAAHQTVLRDLQTFSVEVLTGTGMINDEQSVRFTPSPGSEECESRILTFDVLLIATGSCANRFPPADFSLTGVFDSDTISNINYLPKRMVVQGAGIIGLEYALIFSKLGTEVIVVEVNDRVVPMLDTALQEACVKTMQENGVEILLKTAIKSVRTASDQISGQPSLEVYIDGGRTLKCDSLLSALGRHGCVDGLGLDALKPMGLTLGRGSFISVNAEGHTGVGQIYAVGDVAGANLATMGQAQAIRSVRVCFGSGLVKTEHDRSFHPYGIWTIPEIAWAGITEQKAEQDGMNVGTARSEFSQTVRGCVTHEEGFLKLIYDRADGRVLGVHLFGENSCDLVNYGCEVVNQGHTIFDILQFVFPAVTYHELYHQAATEAKVRLRGAQNLAAVAAWRKVAMSLRKSLEESNTNITVQAAFERAFAHFDSDHSGFLSLEELTDAMSSLGLQCSEQDIHDMIMEATGDPNGSIDYEKFVKVFEI